MVKLAYLYITDARPFTEGILDKCMWIALEKFTRLHEAEYFQDKDHCDMPDGKARAISIEPTRGGGLGDQR